MSIFEQAVKAKLRFATPIGNISAEDLWDLPITSSNKAHITLKDIAVSLQNQINATPTAALDFFDTATTVDPMVQLRFDIVKHIVLEKQAENKLKSEAKVKETQRAEIQELIKLKKQEQLSGKSLEELEAMLS
jgi:hypothetical protein